jgi:hypothetical protein
MTKLRPIACALIVTAAAACAFVTAMPQPAAARDWYSEPYSIMAPEPWVAPKYRSPRGLPQKPNSATTQPLPERRSAPVAQPAPPLTLPNGRIVPNLPPRNQGMVPGGGRETFGDRALRCAHQSGLYGVPAGEQPTYMHFCTQ